MSESFSEELKKELVKQAMKEYAMKQANASSFDWEEEM